MKMTKTAIRVEHLGKHYRIGQRESYKTFRDAITNTAAAPLRRLMRKSNSGNGDEYFWALKDVSFEVEPGEVVGIIGRNGTGKSTLLKILSRITSPSSGSVELHGRISSLLEVGTGFHPELTGRENIYLSGSILGMKRREIDQKFDDIVKFAEVEKFLDTPAKRYSSGMYVRLAFAVAAHLEPEILLVDEVLAVGDASFQKKCLSKMQSVGEEGRTVLFVSHNMPAITRLCPRTILLDAGSVMHDGPSSQVVGGYLRSGTGSTASREWPDSSKAPGDDIARLLAVRVLSEGGEVTDVVDICSPVGIEMEFEVIKPGFIMIPRYHFYNDEGLNIFVTFENDPVWQRRPRQRGHYLSTAWIPGNLLSEGMVIVNALIRTTNPGIMNFFERDAVAFHVVDKFVEDSARGDFAGHIPGVIRPLLKWTTQFSPNFEEQSSLDIQPLD